MGDGGAFVRRPQRNRALRSQYPENRRLKDSIKETGIVIRTRTTKAASDIGTSSFSTATSIPIKVKPFGSAQFGTSYAPNSWNFWASGTALHDPTPGLRDPQISHKYTRVALSSLRPRVGRHGIQRNNYCEASRLARFQHTPRNRVEDPLEAEA
jgi:hypothetical protein